MSDRKHKIQFVIEGHDKNGAKVTRQNAQEIGKFEESLKRASLAQEGLRAAQAAALAGQRQISDSVSRITESVRVNTEALDANSAVLGSWAGIAAGAGVAASVAFGVSQANATKRIVAFADALGMSSGQLSEFVYVGKDVGLSLEQSLAVAKDAAERVGIAVNEGTGEAADALDILGLSAEDLVKKSPVGMILEIGEAYSHLRTEAEKSAILEVFGNDLTLLIPKLRDGAAGYREMAQQGRDLNAVMSDADMQSIADMSDAVGRLADAGLGEFNQTLATVAPAVEVAATAIADHIGVVSAAATGLSIVVAGRLTSSLAGSAAAMVAAEAATQKKALADLAAAKAAEAKALAASRAALSEQAAAQRVLDNARVQKLAGTAAIDRSKALGVLAAANQRVIATETALAAATENTAKAQALASRGARAASVALGALGGPVSLAVTAGLTAMTFAMGSQADEAEDLRGELNQLMGSVDGLTKAQARQQLQNLGPGLEKAKDAAAEYQEEIDSLKAKMDALGDPFELWGGQAKSYEIWRKELINAEGNLDTAKQAVDDYIARQKELQGVLNGTAKATDNATGSGEDSSKQTADQKDKVDALIASLKQQNIELGKGSKELLKYKLAQQGATEKQIELALAEHNAVEAKKAKIAADQKASQAAKTLAGQHEKAVEALEAERIALEEGAEAARIYRLEQAGFGPDQIARQMEIWKEVEALKAKKKAQEEADKAAEKAAGDFNKGVGDFELTVESIGDAWTRTGDKASEAIANMSKMYQEFAEESVNAKSDIDKIDQKLIENEKRRNDGSITQEQFEKNHAKLKADRAKVEETAGKNQIALYHGLAGAMSSAFAQGSKEAQAFQMIQQGLALYDGIRAVVNAWAAPYPTNLAMVPLTIANVASLLGQMGQSFSGGGGASVPSMSQEQIGFETGKMDNESVVNRLDQQIELLEAIERNGSASALNVDLAAAEYQGALFEWVEDVFDKSRMGFVDAMFDASSESWAAIEAHYQSLEMNNPYELVGDKIRIDAEQFYSDANSLVRVIQDIASIKPGDEFGYTGPFGQKLAEEYGYGDDAHAAFKAAMRNTFTELQGHLNEWAVGSIESLADLSDASDGMKEAFDSITGSTRYATAELNDAYAAFDRISGGDYAGYLEKNIDAISRAEGWLEQLTGAYDEHGNQLTNFQLLLSKDVDLFQDQAAAMEQFGVVLGDTFEGGAEEALNFISSIDLVAESLQKTRDLEDQILELTDAQAYQAEMRRRELSVLTDTQKALQKRVWALKDEQAAQESLAAITSLIGGALNPLFSAEQALINANNAMAALGLTGMTYREGLEWMEDFDADQLVGLADQLGLSFVEIQDLIKEIIAGNNEVSGGGSAGSGPLSLDKAEALVVSANVAVLEYSDIINEYFGGVVPSIEEFNAVFDNVDLSAGSGLGEITSLYSDVIDFIGGLPDDASDLRAKWPGNSQSLKLVEPVGDIAESISDIYAEFLGRLPDQSGLEYWLEQYQNGLSLSDISGAVSGGLEAALHSGGDINGALFDAFEQYLGRLPTQAELDQYFAEIVGDVPGGVDISEWVSGLDLSGAISGVVAGLASTAEAEMFADLKALEVDYSDYQSNKSKDTGPAGLGAALVALDSATDKYNSAVAESQKTVTGTTNAVSSANYAESQRQSLLQQWYTLTNNEVELRKMQLAGLDATNHALQEQIWAYEDAETARQALNDRIAFDDDIAGQIARIGASAEDLAYMDLDAQFDEWIRQAEEVGGDLAAVEELYGLKRAEIAAEYAEQAAEEAKKAASVWVEDAGLNDYLGSVSDYVESQSDLIRDAAQEQIDLLEAWRDTAQDLRDYVEQLRISELSPLGPAQKLAEAQESFAALFVRAEAGDIEAAGQLSSAADTYLNLADGYYGRSDAYTSLFYDVSDSLDSLGIDLLAANDDSAIERINQAMAADIDALKVYAQRELAWSESQAYQLTGISDSLGEWPEKFDAMLGDLAGDIGAAVAAAMPERPAAASSAPYSPDKNGSYWDLKAAQSVPGSSSVSISYAPDKGRDFSHFKTKPVSASIVDPNLPAFASGGDHLGGWRLVGEQGPEIEATGPSRIFNAQDTRRILAGSGNSGGADLSPLLAEIKALRESNQRLEKIVDKLLSEQSGANASTASQLDQIKQATDSVARSNRQIPAVI